MRLATRLGIGVCGLAAVWALTVAAMLREWAALLDGDLFDIDEDEIA